MHSDGATVHSKSSKQKNVTKSSTEAELVALSDSATQGLHVRNFMREQGHDVGPLVIYQDNLMRTMALIGKGRSTSKRSRHIDIRFFWIKERVDAGEAVIRRRVCSLTFSPSHCKEHSSRRKERD